MRLRRRSEQLAWLAFVLTMASAAAAEEPQKWLERMNQALMTLNYDGVFAHIQGGRIETLRIIHRVQDGTVMERLVSLDGSGREFIRTGSQLVCYLPDTRTVLIEQQPEARLLLGSLPKFDRSMSQFYDITARRQQRLIGKKTQLIVVDPKDQYRYGYRLWIDEATGMPLRTELCDGAGRVIEQVVFASISTPERIPDSAFKPDVSAEGFRVLRQVPTPLPPSGPVYSWSALRLPPGFHISARAAQAMPGTPGLVEHLVYTDGIASVSVFVESHMHTGHSLWGSAQLGSTSTFATIVDGHPVTAVGEVPPETVKFIANAMKAQPSPAH
ncbi:MAG TPA: MucB/RseB C-terminal domain-containing protein [Steroidobacteraceae bacterium]|nr:MucB/RseB C-terminal domain-containing protein [Steroidobacteraceae bacterium]